MFDRRIFYYWFVLFPILILITGCGLDENKPVFSNLSPEQTGIHFENTIENSIHFNTLNYPLFYNGAGVGVGDINNDQLPDIFFAGNRVSSRLYLNKGDMKFEDITESAGVATDKWITGVSMVDINNDGLLDLYLSVVSTEFDPPDSRRNLLFINNGDTTFTESAKAYGIDDSSFTTHATFLDYNKDGFLDLYLLNHSPGAFYYDMMGPDSKIKEQSPSYDRLYRNNGDGTFVNVSKEAGILETLGYGLGVVVADFNQDNWPDIYVSNDLEPDDVLYMNNRDGTFRNKASEYLKHTSSTGMGIDAADFNNDGWTDILQVDMMPKDYQERKLKSGIIDYRYFASLLQKGHNYAYSQNTLQLNEGNDQNGNLIFSEIARFAGVAYTEWSWSALFGDFDNDGRKDILVSNGYPKDVNNYDYLIKQRDIRGLKTRESIKRYRYQVMQELQPIDHHNYLFRNEGNLAFSDMSEQWGFRNPSISYGVAYGDLDNDGDLDVVTNNINEPASVYRNNVRQTANNHYLLVKLEGDSLNRQGIGAELILTNGSDKQYTYHTLWRGYESTVDGRIHFGLGNTRRVDSLQVRWPDGRVQVLTDLQADQLIHLKHSEADKIEPNRQVLAADSKTMFRKAKADRILSYKHHEQTDAIDYEIQPLLPYMISQQGPPMATGDVNGDGLDDVFIGGAAGFAGSLFIQQSDGSFAESSKQQPWQADSAQADWGAVFFDANADGHPDLYVASGGYRISPVSELLQDRLYVNTGEGQFIRDRDALPEMLTSTAAIAVGDFTGDSSPDLFVGGRLSPRKYPYPARSWLLENKDGHFWDVTGQLAPNLVDPGGMITDGVWLDFNEDGFLDLVTAGEWMPIKFFKNDDNDRLQDVTQTMGLPPSRGWWYSLEKGDFNGDGRPDLMAGNLGLNFTYTTSSKQLFGVFASDFNNDMVSDIIFSVKEDDTYFPFFGKAKLGRALPFLNNRFPSFQSFAEASLNDIFGARRLNRAIYLQADTFASVYLQNTKDKGFTLSQLSNKAQLSPIMEMISEDVDNDGNLDLIVAGNIYHTEPETSRNDAGNGLWIKGDGKGNFETVPPYKSGLYAPGNVKDIKLINTPAGKALLIANNSDSLQVYLFNNGDIKNQRTVKVEE